MTVSKDSIYELINAPTQVMKQHFVEYFSGDTLDTFRWLLSGNGSSPYNTSGMKNTVNGGYELMPASTYNVTLYMNDIRQFNYNGSVFIASVSGKALSSNRTDFLWGFTGAEEWSGVPSGSQSKACFKHDSGSGGFAGSCSQGTGQTNTSLGGSISVYDGNWHVCKGETKASSCEFSHAGVLGITITTNLPDSKMQLGCEVRSIGGSTGNCAGSINYLEAWNN